MSEPDVTKAGWFAINSTDGAVLFQGSTAHTLLGDPTTLATFYIPVGSNQTLAESYCNFCFLSEGPWLTSDNATTGSDLWNLGVSGAPAESPHYGWGLAAYSQGLFYFGLNDTSTVTAVAPNQTVEWSTNYPGAQDTLPTFGSDLMLEGFSNVQEVAALWASNGTSAWTLPTIGYDFGSAAYANDAFYFGTSSGLAYSILPSGNVSWIRNLSAGVIVATPVVSPNAAYFATTNGTLVALNRTTGATLWTDQLNGSLVSSPVLASNGILYIGSVANTVYALNAFTGAIDWTATTTGNITASPLLYGGRLFVSDTAGVIYSFGGPGNLVSFDESGLPTGASWQVTVGGSALTSQASVIAFNLANGTWDFSVGGSAGYVPTPSRGIVVVNGTSVELNVTFVLPSFRLGVSVVNSTGDPVPGANVSTTGTWMLTNSSGLASFTLPPGTYNVSANDSGYASDSWSVTLTRDENISLTLGRPYVFLGTIPSTNIRINQSGTGGFNISLLTMFNSSPADVFFDWQAVGTLAAGSGWTNFTYAQLPDLIVLAAAVGSLEYPDAWYFYPLTSVLSPTNGTTGAFLPEPVPYVAGSISVNPDPPVGGEPTTLSVTLHNPYTTPLVISDIEFEVSGLNLFGTWTDVGDIYNVILPVGAEQTFSVVWVAVASGHHCVRIVLTYPAQADLAAGSQALQHNYDVEPDMLSGESGSASFTLSNMYQSAEVATIDVVPSLPTGWSTSLELNGADYSTTAPITLDLAAGQTVGGTLTITPSPSTPGTGSVDVQEYINSQLVGGLRKTLQELPATSCGYLSNPWQSDPDFIEVPFVSIPDFVIPIGIIPVVLPISLQMTLLLPSSFGNMACFEAGIHHYFGFTMSPNDLVAAFGLLSIGGLLPLIEDVNAAYNFTLGWKLGPLDLRQAFGPFFNATGAFNTFGTLELAVPSLDNALNLIISDVESVAAALGKDDPDTVLSSIITALSNINDLLSPSFGVLEPSGPDTYAPFVTVGLSNILDALTVAQDVLSTYDEYELQITMDAIETIGTPEDVPGDVLHIGQLIFDAFALGVDWFEPPGSPIVNLVDYLTAIVDPPNDTVLPTVSVETGGNSTAPVGYNATSGTIDWAANGTGFMVETDNFSAIFATPGSGGNLTLTGVGSTAGASVPFTEEVAGGMDGVPGLATGFAVVGGTPVRGLATLRGDSENRTAAWTDSVNITSATATPSDGWMTVTGAISAPPQSGPASVAILADWRLVATASPSDNAFNVSIPVPQVNGSFQIEIEAYSDTNVGSATELTVVNHVVTLDASALPNGLEWEASIGPINVSSNRSAVTVFLPNGTYAWNVSVPAGFFAVPPNGTFVAAGVAETVLVPVVTGGDAVVELHTVYLARTDLQAAFPNAFTNFSEFTLLVNWAGMVVESWFVDSDGATLSPYGPYYGLMVAYDGRADLQAAYPNAFTNFTSFTNLENWAGGTVLGYWNDSWEHYLAPFGYYYDLMMVYDGRSDLQAAYPNAYTDTASYQALLSWAAAVVLGEFPDSAYTTLLPYAPMYEVLG